MKNQILPGISREEYDKIDALNISLLIEGERSMAHLDYASKNEVKPTDAMERGTALHLAVLEPAKFDARVTFFPHPECEAKVRNGSKWEEFKRGRTEDLILKIADFKSVIECRDALRNHPRCKELLDAKGSGEMGFVWTDTETGIPCKGLLDRFCQCWGYSIILDLKSCQDARGSEFSKTIYNFQYHTKSAWYTDGLAQISDVPRRFLWIAIESTGYHGINIFDASEGMMQCGRRNYRKLLDQYSACKKSGIWPSYNLGEESLELPKFAKEI